MKNTFPNVVSIVVAVLAVGTSCARREHSLAAGARQAGLAPRPAYAPVGFSQSAGKRPPPTYRLDPVDMTTSFGSGALQVWFSNAGDPLDAAVLSAAARQVSLVTWPEMGYVPATSSTMNADPNEGRYSAQLVLTPQQALEDRWYALRVAGEIPGASFALDPGNAIAGPDGSRIARFRVGSELTLVAAIQRIKLDGRYSLLFAYSEAIDAPEDQMAGRITIDGAAPDCVLSRGNGNKLGHQVVFLCQHDVLSTARRITYAPPRNGVTGAAVAAQDTDMGSTQLVQLPDGAGYVKLR